MRFVPKLGAPALATLAVLIGGTAGAQMGAAFGAPPTAAFADADAPAIQHSVAAFPDLPAEPGRVVDPNLELLARNPYHEALAATEHVYGEPIVNPYVDERRFGNPYTDDLRLVNPYSEDLSLANPYTAQVRTARMEDDLLLANPYARSGR